MSNQSLTAWGTDPPFSRMSVLPIMHEQNIICSKTLICRRLFAGHVMGSRPMKIQGRKNASNDNRSLIFTELVANNNCFSAIILATKRSAVRAGIENGPRIRGPASCLTTRQHCLL